MIEKDSEKVMRFEEFFLKQLRLYREDILNHFAPGKSMKDDATYIAVKRANFGLLEEIYEKRRPDDLKILIKSIEEDIENIKNEKVE